MRLFLLLVLLLLYIFALNHALFLGGGAVSLSMHYVNAVAVSVYNCRFI